MGSNAAPFFSAAACSGVLDGLERGPLSLRGGMQWSAGWARTRPPFLARRDAVECWMGSNAAPFFSAAVCRGVLDGLERGPLF